MLFTMLPKKKYCSSNQGKIFKNGFQIDSYLTNDINSCYIFGPACSAPTSSEKWLPFCLGLNVLTIFSAPVYHNNLLINPLAWAYDCEGGEKDQHARTYLNLSEVLYWAIIAMNRRRTKVDHTGLRYKMELYMIQFINPCVYRLFYSWLVGSLGYNHIIDYLIIYVFRASLFRCD